MPAGELTLLRWVWHHEAMPAELADGLGLPENLDEQLATLQRGRESR